MENQSTLPASPLIAEYEALLSRTVRMLGFAERGDWDRLIREETAYCGDVERIRKIEIGVHLGEDELWRKASLLEKILEHSMIIRELLQDRRKVLGSRITEAESRGRQIDHYLGWDDAS